MRPDADPDYVDTADQIPLFMTASEVAGLLRVGHSKVASWIRAGELKAADVSERPGLGRPRWRISRQDLNEFLRGRQPVPPPPKTPRRRKLVRPPGWVEYFK